MKLSSGSTLTDQLARAEGLISLFFFLSNYSKTITLDWYFTVTWPGFKVWSVSWDLEVS